MRPTTKLSSYAVVLVAVLGGGAALGAAVGPVDLGGEPETHAADHGSDEGAGAHGGDEHGADEGYALVADSMGLGRSFGFTVTGPDGTAVDRYDVVHDKELHLIVASVDLRQFAHVHPTRDAEGHWQVDLPALPPGPYRAFADFRPTGGPAQVLSTELVVPGVVEAPEPLVPSSVAEVDGFEVSLDADADSTVTITVRRDGEVVTTSPYLGAAGHLVALRQGDLAYVHVHPLEDGADHEPAGPVRFGIELPSAGTYALFFDFLVDGDVHTARFVLEVTR